MRKEMEASKNKLLIAEGDIIDFCRGRLGFTPTEYQEKLLRDESQFMTARWPRQSGKSQCLAALVLYRALARPGSRCIILSPSLRQSRRIIERVVSFLPRLGSSILAGKVLKTRLAFVNGSTIESLPNNPATVRGDTVDLLIIDEASFIQNDQELYDAAVYALATTNGQYIGASTPGSRDTLFYRMCKDDQVYGDVSRHHVTWREAVEPKGPLKKQILEKLQLQMMHDPNRWRREMEAEFADQDDRFFPWDLLMRAVDPIVEEIPDEMLDGASSLPS